MDYGIDPIQPEGLEHDGERAESIYRDALRIRDWSIGVARENGRTRWEIEKIRRDFNSAVEDARYHAARADEAELKAQRMEASSAWKIGRALTYIPRVIVYAIRRAG